MAAADLWIEAPGTIRLLSETQLAIMRALEGDAVVSRPGCHWRNAYPGFYQPTHLLAQVARAELRQPTPLCWGYRAALCPEDAHAANASVPVHLLTGHADFDERRLSRNPRSDLRRARRLVEFRRLSGPALLLEQGYEVFDVDYRIPPPARWRDEVGDVKSALGWLARHAAEYHVDPTRIMENY